MPQDLVFDEEWYLSANPDVAQAVASGRQKSGRDHYFGHGYKEGRRPLPPPPQKYELSLCAIVRDEGPYLLEWIAFHWAVGVEHFYVYDNDSRDDTRPILAGLERLGIVTYLPWPDDTPAVAASGLGPQVPAYNDFLRFAHETRWVGFVDLDEFVVPAAGVDLPEWFRGCGHRAVGINWRMFGSSGLAAYDERPVTERFTQRAADDFAPNRHIKTFAIARDIDRVNCHITYLKPGSGEVVDVAGARIDPGADGVHARCAAGALQINHYFTRSRQEWTAKRNRGRVSKAAGDRDKYRSLEEFEFYDRNEVRDESALRFADETRRNMAALRQLTRRP